MTVVYNEIDPYAVAWLRNLILAGLIAAGDVDTRSIEDVRPDDYRKYRQVHLFAGIGVWSHAARLAGIADDEPLWSASCPCQPFSAAGKGGGFADERHLWPAVLHLVQALRPVRIVGEQVSSTDGLGWFDLVQTDLEASGYAVGALDTCSAGVGAPNIRQRLYWMADADNPQRWPEPARGDHEHGPGAGWPQGTGDAQGRGHAGGVDYTAGARHEWAKQRAEGASWNETRLRLSGEGCEPSRPSPLNGFWRDADWLYCRDGRWRPVEPGSFPLVTGAPARVGRLRAYGNAINAQVAAEFLRCRP